MAKTGYRDNDNKFAHSDFQKKEDKDTSLQKNLGYEGKESKNIVLAVKDIGPFSLNSVIMKNWTTLHYAVRCYCHAN